MLHGRVQRIRPEEVLRICERYGVNEQWLLHDKGKMKADAVSQESMANKLAQEKAGQLMQGLNLSDATRTKISGVFMALERRHAPTIELLLNAGGATLFNDFVQVPRHDVEASAGPGIFISDESVVDHISFRREWLTHTLGVDPKRVCVIQARGDSMQPTIDDADLLLIDTRQGKPKSEGIYVIQLHDALLVKRLRFKLSGTVEVVSDNPQYTPETISAAALEQLIIVGRVMWRGARL